MAPVSPPPSPCVAVRMLSVVAGYGGRVCLSMRRGTPDILGSVTERTERSAAMAGVFDIDLDQPEETVSDDENEEVVEGGILSVNAGFVTAETLGRR